MRQFLLSNIAARTIAVFAALGLTLLVPAGLKNLLRQNPHWDSFFPAAALQIGVFLLSAVLCLASLYFLSKCPWWVFLAIAIISVVLFPVLSFYVVDADGEGVAYYTAFAMPINFALAFVAWFISRRFWKVA